MNAATGKKPDVETLIAGALQHGQDSEPDHEAGDLQDFLRAGWALLTQKRRSAMVRSLAVLDAVPGQIKAAADLCHDDGFEKVLAVFENQGASQGAHVEIASLQIALRACWGAMDPSQRGAFLGLESVQDAFEGATCRSLSDEGAIDTGCIVSFGWSHIFVGKREETTRWIFDAGNQILTCAQILQSNRWVDLDSQQKADLLESIQDNEADKYTEDFELAHFACSSEQLPSWEEMQEIASCGEEEALIAEVERG